MGTKKMCEADYDHIVSVLSGIGGDANVDNREGGDGRRVKNSMHHFSLRNRAP